MITTTYVHHCDVCNIEFDDEQYQTTGMANPQTPNRADMLFGQDMCPVCRGAVAASVGTAVQQVKEAALAKAAGPV